MLTLPLLPVSRVGDPSTKEHGMGIGAFESREYIREIGGSLAVTSTEGGGSCFSIRLPVHGETSTTSLERTADVR